MRLGALAVALVLASDVAAACCLPTPRQIKWVRVIGREAPDYYVRKGVERWNRDLIGGETAGDFTETTIQGAADKGVVLVVLVSHEVTLRYEDTGEEVRSLISKWNRVSRFERVWWLNDDGPPPVGEGVIQVAIPCCDVIDGKYVPCVAGLNEAFPVYPWMLQRLERAGVGSRPPGVSTQGNGKEN